MVRVQDITDSGVTRVRYKLISLIEGLTGRLTALASISLAFCGLLAACNGSAGVDRPVSNGAGPTNVAELSWTPPTKHTDGTPLLDRSGYKIYIRPTEGSYTELIDLSNPALTTYVAENLAPGTYFFYIAAYDSAGVPSDGSNAVSITITATSNTPSAGRL